MAGWGDRVEGMERRTRGFSRSGAPSSADLNDSMGLSDVCRAVARLHL